MINSYIPTVEEILYKLPEIFPEGIENRNYLIREIAAKTIFIMFYVEAIEGYENKIRPDQVTKMSDKQAQQTMPEEREAWYTDSLTPGKLNNIENRWYASNTREPIRDETLRFGLISVGAVLELKNLPTTSSKPRYYLSKDFANLFSPNTTNKDIKNWRKRNLSSESLMRIKINKQRGELLSKSSNIFVQLPNGETRKMSPGPSSLLSKQVIEEFAPKFLKEPALIMLSESSNKIISQDQNMINSLGLTIEKDKNLPDIIIADIGSNNQLLIFVEVVASDGAVSQKRKDDLLKIAKKGNYDTNKVLFITAFEDRSSRAFKKLTSSIAWGSLVWFASEPEGILIFGNKEIQTLSDINKIAH